MALGTHLPFWPALLFTYLEPITLILGFNAAYTSPSTFVTTQLPTSSLVPVPPAALILSYSLGNIFLLLAALAVLCTAITRDARVTKAYLLIIAVGDLGHIYSSYAVMGPKVFWEFGEYNDMMWGNIGFSAFLHVNRMATLLGVFGRVGSRG
ncbi:hypothetical protein BU24DRAFT_419299 [Aaosphaeria arxii CBS 175.79]|uniref:DUF7704 domain-containing protein n=1 Tax=Aaosphaeria arxii CBS 175.79 TaxID=1450172 RepID=A0A6A5Y2K2_9PLEO|nr:uncharacterized protein BU24DRAFT_419299 [Aaosphaeria arxii CBS 175.79]KAF2019678.1 hypothetical protein BU24DRAFT_419299 [Aaosphaeria arxii CBS 175.79]